MLTGKKRFKPKNCFEAEKNPKNKDLNVKKHILKLKKRQMIHSVVSIFIFSFLHSLSVPLVIFCVI